MVAALTSAFWPSPGILGSLVEGVLGGIVVAVVFFGVAFVLNRRDLNPLVTTLTRRLRR